MNQQRRCETCEHWVRSNAQSGKCRHPHLGISGHAAGFPYGSDFGMPEVSPQFGCVLHEFRQDESITTAKLMALGWEVMDGEDDGATLQIETLSEELDLWIDWYPTANDLTLCAAILGDDRGECVSVFRFPLPPTISSVIQLMKIFGKGGP